METIDLTTDEQIEISLLNIKAMVNNRTKVLDSIITKKIDLLTEQVDDKLLYTNCRSKWITKKVIKGIPKLLEFFFKSFTRQNYSL